MPLVDSYVTDDIHSDGMHARPVVGGIFIKMLADRGDAGRNGRAAIRRKSAIGPRCRKVPPKVNEIVPSGQHKPSPGGSRSTKPAEHWTGPKFDDSGWKEGPGRLRHEWNAQHRRADHWKTDDIWLRRELTMPERDVSRSAT